MKWSVGCLFLTLVWVVSWAYPPVSVQPEQVHIAYGDPTDPGQMWVVWSTPNDTTSSKVRYNAAGSSQVMTAQGVSRLFTDGGDEHRGQYIHRVKLTRLVPGQKYEYMCGSDQGWSDLFSFRAMRNDSNWSPRFALYGDLGNKNAQSLPRLQLEAEQGMYDAVLHIGDFAYDMNVDNGRVGDEFLRQIEPIAANLPYMTCPGNHEMKYNFSNYKHRFVMPGDELGEKMFYSFNMGPAHIISLSTEYYFFIYYGIVQPIEQYRWLEKDLIEANKPENRAKRPWIITMGHRPMYCSNKNGDDCTRHESIIRTGIPFIHWLGLEPLYQKYGVDLALWAHEHSYERLWPVFDRKVYNGSVKEPYTNPGAPVHIITGSAGCQEIHDNFTKNTAEWSAFRSDDYGYTRMTIHNSTHLYMEQVSDNKDGKILDSLWIKKAKHGPYSGKEWRAPDADRFERRPKNKGYRMFSVNES
ncbi:acid phosphatase type 7-like isoform X2 [Babylonia areolata]